MSNNSIDVILKRTDVWGIDSDQLENKLILYFQNVVSVTKSKCDVELVNQTYNRDTGFIHVTLILRSSGNNTEKEIQGKRKILQSYNAQTCPVVFPL